MKKIALTFDDGPWKSTTPHILDVLEEYKLPATFMIWGEHAEKYPELLKREANNPLFTIGNHTYHHVDLTKTSIDEGISEIKQNDELIKKIIGIVPSVIRPPYGSVNNNVLSYLNRPAIIWSLDTKSWDHHSKEKVLRNIEKAQDGDVVLMHDYQPADSEAIRLLIEYLLQNNFKIVSLKELVGDEKFSKARVIYSRNKIIE